VINHFAALLILF